MVSGYLLGARSERDHVVVCDQTTYQDLAVLVTFSDDGCGSSNR